MLRFFSVMLVLVVNGVVVFTCTDHAAGEGAPDSQQYLALESLDARGHLPEFSLAVLEDPGGRLPFDSIAGRAGPDREERFRLLPEATPRLGLYSDSVYWLRLFVRNRSARPLEWLLEFRHGGLYILELFETSPAAPPRKLYSGGDMLPFSHRAVAHRFPVVPLRSAPGESTLYIRIQSPAPQKIPLRAWGPADFDRGVHQALFGFHLFYGALGIMVVYNLLLFWTVGGRDYLHLSFFIFCVLVGYLKVDGFAYQYLWPDLPVLNLTYNLIFSIGLISFLFFLRRFLNLRYYVPRFYIFLRALVAMALLIVLTFPLQMYWTALRIYISGYVLLPTALMLSLGSFFLGIYIWRRGNPAGLYYMIAVLTFSAIGNLPYLEWIGLLPSLGLFTAMGGKIGFVAYVALLSFGTGQRFRAERDQLQLLNAGIDLAAPWHDARPGMKSATTPPTGEAIDEAIEAADSSDTSGSSDGADFPAHEDGARKPGPTSEGGDWTITPRTREKLQEALAFLRENYRENVSRDELALRLEINSDNLGRFFKMFTGEKMGDFVNRLRVDEAARLLRETDDKIIDVAFAVGFESLKTFNRNFAAFRDMTPSQYRRAGGRTGGDE